MNALARQLIHAYGRLGVFASNIEMPLTIIAPIAHHLAVGLWPTQTRENILGALVGHPHPFADAERTRRGR
jgi:hypothetical protein